LEKYNSQLFSFATFSIPVLISDSCRAEKFGKSGGQNELQNFYCLSDPALAGERV